MGRVLSRANLGCRPNLRWPGAGLACAIFGLLAAPSTAATIQDAMVKTYQNNPQLNAERARLNILRQTGELMAALK